MCSRMALQLWVLTAMLGVCLVSSTVPTREQVGQIDKAIKSLKNISTDLCKTSGCLQQESCPKFNPCARLECPQFSAKLVCYFCCCDSRVFWTNDGVHEVDCPVVQILPRPTTNLFIPVPLANFLKNVAPTATQADGYSREVVTIFQSLPKPDPPSKGNQASVPRIDPPPRTPRPPPSGPRIDPLPRTLRPPPPGPRIDPLPRTPRPPPSGPRENICESRRCERNPTSPRCQNCVRVRGKRLLES